MSEPDKLHQLLDLQGTDSVVFSCLINDGRQSVATLSKHCRLPRSTVVDTLKRLHARGLVRQVAIGKRTHWKTTDTMKIAERFLVASEMLMTPSIELEQDKKMQLKISKETEFVVFVGWYNMVKVYEREIKAHPHERLYAIQSAKSAEAAFTQAGQASFEPMNRAIREHGLIVEGILSEGMFELYEKQPREWLESMEGRMNAIRVVPDRVLDFSAELVLFRDVALFTNWKEEVLILIKNADLLTLIKRLYELLYDTGKTVDQNAYIRRLLTETKNQSS
jgi:DNA-binding Lrp family transcriptional regulator